MKNTLFYQNTAFAEGGAIKNVGGILTATNCKFLSNKANHGGGICNYGEMSLSGCQFTYNWANWGAGIFNNGKMTLSYCVFKENEASSGNAIWNSKGNTSDRKIRYCSFLDTNPGYDKSKNEIYAESGSVDAEYNWWGSNNSPSAKFYGNVDYSPWIKDIAGKPTVNSINPLNGTTKVARNKTITIKFNEYVKFGDNYWIELLTSKGKAVAISTNLSGKTLTIKHSALLSANTKYYLKLHGGCVMDMKGNSLATKTFSFTTGSS